MTAIKPILILLLIAILSCCKKDNKINPSEDPLSILSYDAKVENESISITYTLSTDNFNESGVYYSPDSASLIGPDIGTNSIKKPALAGEKKYSLAIPAPAPSTIIWFRICASDTKNKQSWGPIIKVSATSVPISNISLSWADNFNKKMRIEDWLYRDIMLIGDNADTVLKNYEITLGSSSCMLWKIAPEKNQPGSYRYYIQVPAAAPVGDFDFQVKHKGNMIFSDRIEILKGDLYETLLASVFPEQIQVFSYFTFNSDFYAVTLFDQKKVYKWDLIKNTWDITGSVPPNILLSEGLVGKQHLNKVWFPLVKDGDTITQITYDPVADKWEVFPIANSYQDDYIRCFDSFLYQGELYYLIGISSNRPGGQYKPLLMKLDIENRSLGIVATLPDDAAGYKAIVIDNAIFITATLVESNESATSFYFSKLFEYNPHSKTFTQKAPMIFKTVEKGSLNPSLFEYNKRLYFYGGETSTGYFSNISYDLYEFDPAKNTWKQIFAIIDFTKASALNNFCFVRGSKVYIGFGLRPLYQRTNTVVMLDFNWHY